MDSLSRPSVAPALSLQQQELTLLAGAGTAAAPGVNPTAAESVLDPFALTAFSLTEAATPLVKPVNVMGLELSAGYSSLFCKWSSK